jgi:alanine racemase
MPSIANPPERAWADIDLGALKANARTVARISGARLLPMVKANAYGLGVIPVVRALEALDPWGYGVATVEEGIELRTAGITRPVVVFTPLQTAHVSRYLAHALRPTIGDAPALSAWLAQGSAPFHLEADTGMARSGFQWFGDGSWREQLRDASGFEGFFTHFHSAEDDAASVHRQWQRFQQMLEALPRRPLLLHAANSAAALQGPRYAADLVRPGIFLFGGDAGGPAPEPVVRLRAPVVATRIVRSGNSVSYGGSWIASRDTRVATLALGYADGMLRSLGNHGAVELHGQLAPVVGRVTMDFTMVATEVAAAPGDVATVYGGLVSLDEQARRAGSISYELLTSLGPRVPRRYA